MHAIAAAAVLFGEEPCPSLHPKKPPALSGTSASLPEYSKEKTHARSF